MKIVAALSPQLFAMQPADVQNKIISDADRWDSTFITNRSRRLFYDWIFNPLAAEYSLSSDRDNRWRTGGSIEEVCLEAGIDPESIVKGIERFVKDRPQRLQRLSKGIASTSD